MPQWRKLHVKTIDSLDINDMPDDFTRLMWVLLPLGLDSQGRGIDDSAWIKAKLFPLRRDVALEQVEASMAWYATRGMVLRYEIDDRAYFCATKFLEYQGKTEREAPSKIPAPVLYKTKKGLAKVKSKSRPTQELVMERSMTDVDSDSDVDADTEADTDAPAGDKPPAGVVVDPVLELAEVFEQVAGIKKPTPSGAKGKAQLGVLWWNPLREMVHIANGSAAEVMRQAVTQMRQSHLTISAPNSVLKVFTSVYGEHQAPVSQVQANSAVGRMLAYTEELRRGNSN